MFSSLHLLQTKTLNCQIAEGGGELGVHQYLIIFLKFVQVHQLLYTYIQVYQLDSAYYLQGISVLQNYFHSA